jgi:hypothetical protein
MRVRQPAPDLLGDRVLVRRVSEREEQTDRDRLGIELGQRRQVDGREHALGADPLAYSEAALQRNERLGVVVAQPVEVRPRLAAQVQMVLEPFGRHEGRARSGALEESVGGDGRAVRETLDSLRAELERGRDDRILLSGRGRHLDRLDRALVDEYGIGEGPADVDAENGHGCE